MKIQKLKKNSPTRVHVYIRRSRLFNNNVERFPSCVVVVVLTRYRYMHKVFELVKTARRTRADNNRLNVCTQNKGNRGGKERKKTPSQ